MAALHGSFIVTSPPERIPVLIGRSGNVKRSIEERLGVRLNINSETGVVEITLAKPAHEGGDPVSLFKARDVVQAIACGFNPEKAMKLAEGDDVLIVLDLTEHVGKEKEALRRVKARIIGSGGKTRRIIEEYTHVDLSIYDDAVAVIGSAQDAAAAQEAVMMLINGSPHTVVYRFLDNYAQRRKLSGGMTSYR